MESFIIVILFVFVGLLITIMFLFLKKTVIRINQQSKDYFVDKLQVYDDLINEKEKQLKGLNEKIESNKKEIEGAVEQEKSDSSVYLYDFRNIDYQDEDIFQKMKMIDQKFQIDEEGLIRNFIKEYFDEENVPYYQKLVRIRKKFNRDRVYQLVSKTSSEQEDVARTLLGDMVSILDDFMKRRKKFDILKFISYFDEIISGVDPYIYVYVGNSSVKYDFIHPFVKTCVDEHIYRGVSIVYKKRLYDFSLK